MRHCPRALVLCWLCTLLKGASIHKAKCNCQRPTNWRRAHADQALKACNRSFIFIPKIGLTRQMSRRGRASIYCCINFFSVDFANPQRECAIYLKPKFGLLILERTTSGTKMTTRAFSTAVYSGGCVGPSEKDPGMFSCLPPQTFLPPYATIARDGGCGNTWHAVTAHGAWSREPQEVVPQFGSGEHCNNDPLK